MLEPCGLHAAPPQSPHAPIMLLVRCSILAASLPLLGAHPGSTLGPQEHSCHLFSKRAVQYIEEHVRLVPPPRPPSVYRRQLMALDSRSRRSLPRALSAHGTQDADAAPLFLYMGWTESHDPYVDDHPRADPDKGRKSHAPTGYDPLYDKAIEGRSAPDSAP